MSELNKIFGFKFKDFFYCLQNEKTNNKYILLWLEKKIEKSRIHMYVKQEVLLHTGIYPNALSSTGKYSLLEEDVACFNVNNKQHKFTINLSSVISPALQVKRF